MPTAVESFKPYATFRRLVRRLETIAQESGYNTNPKVRTALSENQIVDPKTIPLSDYPLLVVTLDGAINVSDRLGPTSTGWNRLGWDFSVWGFARSQSDLEAAKHALLADVLAACWSDETLEEGGAGCTLYLLVDTIDWGGFPLATDRGFWRLGLTAVSDLRRGGTLT